MTQGRLFTVISAVAILLVALEICHRSAQALTCACNECPSETCDTEPHRESSCFKSVERIFENGTYTQSTRLGCISGADFSLASLQCYVHTSMHKEPRFIACCKEDLCNDYLPDPTVHDDPRWSITEPSISVPDVPILLILLSMLAFLVFIAGIYGLGSKFRVNKTTTDSQDSICSFKIDFSDSTMKNQFISHINSSSGSTHTYSVSDHLTHKLDSPQENTCASYEYSSCVADLTSGVGTTQLKSRTMARVVLANKMVPLGSGRFGRVFKGTYAGEDIAVKAFRSIDCESWQREEKILKKLNHVNIVTFLASETATVEGHVTETWMFLEFCPYGSLCDFLDHTEICGPQQAIKLLFSIIRGLCYLHLNYSEAYKPPIAHRDIKSKNILMRTPDNCCIADFGHAVVKVNDNLLDFGGYEHLQVGTIRYMAPEILRPTSNLDITQIHTFTRTDIYQFALVAWEICNRTALDVLHPSEPHRLPFEEVVPQNPDLGDMIKIVCEDGYRPRSSPHWRKHPVMTQLTTLIAECWHPKPDTRLDSLNVKRKLEILHDQSTHRPLMNPIYPALTDKKAHNSIIDNTI